ncbi:LON peptidase substrate-binding domain-containing protein [Vibrio ouci]|uniref:ATP-dependent protease n=1 Tax=Vibrio ouci TaxID=2499078 RepID=A0A4Y8WDN2_9VIBR|nr:LON peptidase substrate-binding domain-containing protein [Vibrio ouci]TFH90723.1 ATP-dependent protease [Vibrio ouci]
MSEVMLFPLSSVVLPEGKMRLRIFEPRYKRLVSQAMQGEGTFGVCLFDRDNRGQELSNVGTLAKIIDFELLEDGLLGISITGLSKFKIQSVRVEYDGLRLARIETLPSWSAEEIEANDMRITTELVRVYQQFPDLGELYQQRFFDDASWVSQRWLELLPVTNQQFDELTLQKNCHAALSFIKKSLES